MCRTDKYGFPNRYVPRIKSVKGFQTGDIVKAIITKGKYAGEYFGRIAVRVKGNFAIKVNTSKPFDVNHRYCQVVHKKDGYSYVFN